MTPPLTTGSPYQLLLPQSSHAGTASSPQDDPPPFGGSAEPGLAHPATPEPVARLRWPTHRFAPSGVVRAIDLPAAAAELPPRSRRRAI